MIKRIKKPPPSSKGVCLVNIPQEDLINCYVNQWVMEWCKKYHPEAFEEAKTFVKEHFKDNNTI